MLPKIDNAADFVWDMFTKFKVITYLGDWFGAEGHVRFSYALDTWIQIKLKMGWGE